MPATLSFILFHSLRSGCSLVQVSLQHSSHRTTPLLRCDRGSRCSLRVAFKALLTVLSCVFAPTSFADTILPTESPCSFLPPALQVAAQMQPCHQATAGNLSSGSLCLPFSPWKACLSVLMFLRWGWSHSSGRELDLHLFVPAAHGVGLSTQKMFDVDTQTSFISSLALSSLSTS